MVSAEVYSVFAALVLLIISGIFGSFCFIGFDAKSQFDIIVVEEILRFIRIFRVFKNLVVIFFSFTKNATFTGNLKNSVQNFAAFSYFYVP